MAKRNDRADSAKMVKCWGRACGRGSVERRLKYELRSFVIELTLSWGEVVGEISGVPDNEYGTINFGPIDIDEDINGSSPSRDPAICKALRTLK